MTKNHYNIYLFPVVAYVVTDISNIIPCDIHSDYKERKKQEVAQIINFWMMLGLRNQSSYSYFKSTIKLILKGD